MGALGGTAVQMCMKTLRIKPLVMLLFLSSALFGAGCQSVEGIWPEGARLDEVEARAVLAHENCSTPSPGETPLRRLTNAEYRNTLEDLGVPAAEVAKVANSLPSEPISLGFRNGARALNVDALLAQEYSRAAQALAGYFRADCSSVNDSRACARDFVSELGLSLYRRPLTSSEVEAHLAIFDQATEGGDSFGRALRWVVEAMLQSPHFLYRVEIPEESVSRVTGYEMASRLSYTFWRSGPDQELLAAAEAGELQTDEQIRVQVERLLNDEKALRLYEFFEQWLDLDELHEIERNPELYPDLPGNLARLLRAENRAFVTGLLKRGDSDLGELLTTERTFVNAALAEHYDIDGDFTNSFVEVEAPGRSGVLTQGMLAVHDGPTRTSIVRRGLKIRTDFLCQTVPKPPDDVDVTLEGIGPEATQAERLEQHRENASCLGCHQMMDPIGVAFEEFDAVGRQRTQDEHGAPITTEGELTMTMDIDGKVDGVGELAEALASSREVEQCYLLQNFRFFFGRDAAQRDLCTQAQFTKHFQDSGQNLPDLFLGLAQTDAFLYKAGSSPIGGE